MGIPQAMIAFIVIGLPTIMIWALVSRAYRHRELKLQLEAEIEAAKAAQKSPKAEMLEQRVRVLERIVTDKGIDVADEIERLRDKQPLN